MPCCQKHGEERDEGGACRYAREAPGTHPLAQLGSYHYVSGVDASSSASLAAYINSLTYAIEDNSAWFSKAPQWKVRNGCYWYACCA